MADIVGCIAFTGSILRLCYQYGTALADSPSEARKFSTELTSLGGILLGVQAIIQDDSVPESSLVDIETLLNECSRDLQVIYKRLDAHHPNVVEGKLHRGLRRAVWPFRRDDTLKMINSLERLKSGLNIALNTFSVKMIQAQGSQLDQIGSTVEQIRAFQLDAREEQLQKEVARWLSAPDQHAQHQRNRQLRYARTGSWMFYSKPFERWRQGKSPVLWYQGDTGSGKTLLACYIIEQMQQVLFATDSIMTYYYFDSSTAQTLPLKSFVSSILRQMSTRSAVAMRLEQAFNHASGSPYGVTPPADGLLEQQLRDSLQEIADFFLVIDAVDEAEFPSEVCTLIERIKTWCPGKCHIFFTSRPGIIMSGSLPNAVEMTAPGASLQKDILEYVNHRLETEERLRRMSRAMKNNVRYCINRDAGGMIKWVQCLLDSLCQTRTDRDVQEALRTMPTSLAEVYQRSLNGINGYDRLYAQRMLPWLCFALEPLDILTVAEIAVFEIGMTTISEEACLHDSRDVLSILSGLTSFNDRSKKIRLSHQSVREFLAKNADPSFCFPILISHKTIAEVCLNYMLMNDFAQGPLDYAALRQALIKYPLLTYASRKWPFHVQLSEAESELQPLILRLMTPRPNSHYLFWLQIILLHSVHGFTDPGQSEIAKDPIPLYYAASYGLTHTVKSLIALGADLESRAGRFGGTPLHSACYRRKEDVITVLLDAGAKADVFDDLENTPYCLLSSWSKASPELLERLEFSCPHSSHERELYPSRYNEQNSKHLSGPKTTPTPSQAHVPGHEPGHRWIESSEDEK